ncbi:Hypothetical predicted protein [Mytilus galloprovincialis]|uniref:Uncharacterized protein n=1 Tax=Mytilus galloprovincialis TaxID=29158 RepID=A0A8B6CPE0_MYTGA|nr:Hypothetical predicted protein [Mytilus galloprovincialis]
MDEMEPARKKDHMSRIMKDGTIHNFIRAYRSLILKRRQKTPSTTEAKQIRLAKEKGTGHVTSEPSEDIKTQTKSDRDSEMKEDEQSREYDSRKAEYHHL